MNTIMLAELAEGSRKRSYTVLDSRGGGKGGGGSTASGHTYVHIHFGLEKVHGFLFNIYSFGMEALT